MSEPMPSKPIRVIIVDDTRSIRMMIRAMLSRSPRIEVVAEAGDPYEARELIRELNPDVITLDVVMPRMDGLSFLERVMRLRPMPVVMISTRTTENSAAAIQALSLGAFDCVDIASLNRPDSKIDLAQLIEAAASSNPRGPSGRVPSAASQVAKASGLRWNGKTVLIGSSTGGVDALTTVLGGFPVDCPPTVIAQHMPPAFLESFTARLDRTVPPRVRLAEDGMQLTQGEVLFAPGNGTHLVLGGDRPSPKVGLVADDGSEMFTPSINVLFASAVKHAKRIVAVMLTGMGKDGAEPMLDLRQAGAHTIAQDSASSVVDGMPRAARENGAAMDVASLTDMSGAILAQVVKQERETSA